MHTCTYKFHIDKQPKVVVPPPDCRNHRRFSHGCQTCVATDSLYESSCLAPRVTSFSYVQHVKIYPLTDNRQETVKGPGMEQTFAVPPRVRYHYVSHRASGIFFFLQTYFRKALDARRKEKYFLYIKQNKKTSFFK